MLNPLSTSPLLREVEFDYFLTVGRYVIPQHSVVEQHLRHRDFRKAHKAADAILGNYQASVVAYGLIKQYALDLDNTKEAARASAQIDKYLSFIEVLRREDDRRSTYPYPHGIRP